MNHRDTHFFKILNTLLLLLVFGTTAFSQNALGLFTEQGNVGSVLHPGAATYDPGMQLYQLTGSGLNIWGPQDEFHWVWKKMEGDFILQTRAGFIGAGVDPHRKLGWMVRSSLDSSATMACATVHGDGLTSLQYRKAAGGEVVEVQSAAKDPDIIQLERKGNLYTMSVAQFGQPWVVSEVKGLNLGQELYVGLFVCAHNEKVLESALFSNVRITVPAKESFVPYRDYLGSNIEILDVATGHRQIVYTDSGSVQAPNWTPDNKYLIYNTNKGLMYRFNLEKGEPELLDTDFVKANNNDHVLSFDGKMLGLSSSSGDAKQGSLIYTVPVAGGKPTQITPTGPSYLHGWSPDGQWLTYTAQRKGDFDIYKIPAKGGKEIRLTTAAGLDDGSEYSPDGKYIYFNSLRSGKMELWRMKPDGKDQEQLTKDQYNNWFPHISPDGKWIVFLSFMEDVDPADHPFYRPVYIRMMPAAGGAPKIIAYFYGGQGSINTPSWSPDSKKIAFISNTAVEKEK